MPHPYEGLEGTPLWQAIDRAVADLERNGDLRLTTARSHVIGRLCRSVAGAGLSGVREDAPPA